MCNQYMEYLNNYFGGKEIKPICREERQYALFLYNKLLNMVGKDYNSIEDNDKDIYLKIFDLDEKSLPKHTPKLLKVYYEVTFMRDFLEQEKQIYENDKDLLKVVKDSESSFNHKLFDFVKNNTEIFLSYTDENIDYFFNYIDNDGKKYINNQINNNYNIYPEINYSSRCDKIEKKYFLYKFMSKIMSNKADLGILYEDRQTTKHLKLVECKYLSDVDKPNLLKNLGGKIYIPQYVIQYYITKFICDKLITNNKIEADYPVLVNFIVEKEDEININKDDDICNNCKKKNKCIEKEDKDYCIKFLSEFIKGNAKYIKLDSLIPNELKNNI